MLLSLFITFGISACIAVAGIAVNGLLGRKITLLNAIWSQLIGMATLLSSMAIGLALGLTAGQIFLVQSIIFISLAATAVVQLARGWSRNKFQAKNVRLSARYLALGLPTLIFSYLAQGRLFETAATFRIGPDLFGWSSAALTLLRGDTIAVFADRVRQQLGATDLLESFQRPIKVGANSIYQISSYSDQISAEFLIGAHRTGAPGLMAGLGGVIGEKQFAASYTALLGWAVFVVALICFQAARDMNLAKWESLLLAAVVPISASTLSVTLEGGFGQLLTLPFLVFAVTRLRPATFKFRDFSASLFLIVIVGAATYFDLLYFALPLLLALLAFEIISRRIQLSRQDVKPLLRQLAVTLVATFYFIPDGLRLIVGLFSNPTAGGWHQGRLPLPSNIFGFLPWLPTGLYKVTPRSDLDWLADISVTALVFIFILVTFRSSSMASTSLLLLGYAYLCWSVYSTEPVNNYRLWKFSMYASMLFVFALMSGFDSSTLKTISTKLATKWESVLRKAAKVIAASLIALSMVTTVIWSVDWVNSRKMQMSGEDRAKFVQAVEGRDVIFEPSYGQLLPLEVSLYTDLHYVSFERVAGEPTWRSDPARDLVIIRPNSMPCTIEDAEALTMNKVASVDVIGGNSLFTVFRVNLK